MIEADCSEENQARALGLVINQVLQSSPHLAAEGHLAHTYALLLTTLHAPGAKPGIAVMKVGRTRDLT